MIRSNASQGPDRCQRQQPILTIFAGVFGANAVPHFVKGITKERFPTPFGASPLINVIAGWAMFILAGLLLVWAHIDRFPVAAAVSGAVGTLLMAVFHAQIGAFGRRS